MVSQFTDLGVLKYGPGIRLIVEIDQAIADYYRPLIPKHHQVSFYHRESNVFACGAVHWQIVSVHLRFRVLVAELALVSGVGQALQKYNKLRCFYTGIVV